MSRIMAIDFGEARVGLAICDETETLASGYGFLKFESYKLLVDKIKAIMDSEAVELVAVGNPINLDGSPSRSSKKAAKLAGLLEDADIPVTMVDERLTSVEAARQIHASGKKAVKGRVDEVAATIILQALLDARKAQ